MTSKRDDFTESTKRLIGNRVGWKCSYLGCEQDTVGPSSSDISKNINNGVAAHICAAAKGGPRYDASMTPEERKSFDNGIWMCRNHAALIDSDHEKYSVEMLKKWKKIAEDNAYKRMSSPIIHSNKKASVYSTQDKRAFEFIDQILPYETIQLIKEEIFGKFVIKDVITPFDDLLYYANDPKNKFEHTELENLRMKLISQAETFKNHFSQMSAGLTNGYDYIDMNKFREWDKNFDERYYEQYQTDTQNLANMFCITALELRGKQYLL